MRDPPTLLAMGEREDSVMARTRLWGLPGSAVLVASIAPTDAATPTVALSVDTQDHRMVG